MPPELLVLPVLLATMLGAQGLAQADGFDVAYRFQPWRAGAGTGALGGRAGHADCIAHDHRK
jgi:hypothetical protein